MRCCHSAAIRGMIPRAVNAALSATPPMAIRDRPETAQGGQAAVPQVRVDPLVDPVDESRTRFDEGPQQPHQTGQRRRLESDDAQQRINRDLQTHHLWVTRQEREVEEGRRDNAVNPAASAASAGSRVLRIAGAELARPVR